MKEKTNPLGNINISPRAIATIAHQAAIQSYGVVGLAAKNFVNGLTYLIVKDPTHGVEVTKVEDKIDIDIYIVVQYGTRIASVAGSVANTVRYHVEKALDYPINEVNVHVMGLRFNGDDS